MEYKEKDSVRERSKDGTSLDRKDMDASLYLEKIQLLLKNTSTEFIDEGDML